MERLRIIPLSSYESTIWTFDGEVLRSYYHGKWYDYPAGEMSIRLWATIKYSDLLAWDDMEVYEI